MLRTTYRPPLQPIWLKRWLTRISPSLPSFTYGQMRCQTVAPSKNWIPSLSAARKTGYLKPHDHNRTNLTAKVRNLPRPRRAKASVALLGHNHNNSNGLAGIENSTPTKRVDCNDCTGPTHGRLLEESWEKNPRISLARLKRRLLTSTHHCTALCTLQATKRSQKYFSTPAAGPYLMTIKSCS